MTLVNSLLVPDEIKYTGEQLRSLWAFERFNLLGDGIVAFIGPCDVQEQHMKDAEDLKASAKIYSERMLHFIVEHFDPDLDRAVLRQRLLIALLGDALNRRLGGQQVRRAGDDLYDGRHKITVSIASVSPVSALIHVGVNISSRNTPVPARGLDDYGIDARNLAAEILAAYAEECASARRSRCKVRPCQ